MLCEFLYFLKLWFKVPIRGYWECGGCDGYFCEVVGCGT